MTSSCSEGRRKVHEPGCTLTAMRHQFRMTKYDPALRDLAGAFTGEDWTSISDIGECFGGEVLTLARYLDVENAHLAVIAEFLDEAEVSQLAVKNVGIGIASDEALRNGNVVDKVDAIEIVRRNLREEISCQLEDSGRFYLHIGFDYSCYLGSWNACTSSVAAAVRRGLHIDSGFPSPLDQRE